MDAVDSYHPERINVARMQVSGGHNAAEDGGSPLGRLTMTTESAWNVLWPLGIVHIQKSTATSEASIIANTAHLQGRTFTTTTSGKRD